mmetsp:Transcript_2588/g.3822  ORF Transcript_2588/g.3822 Transcript_2588/m.3822 type:complete len:110 (-) Transcript_2588:931-1260(-)
MDHFHRTPFPADHFPSRDDSQKVGFSEFRAARSFWYCNFSSQSSISSTVCHQYVADNCYNSRKLNPCMLEGEKLVPQFQFARMDPCGYVPFLLFGGFDCLCHGDTSRWK